MRDLVVIGAGPAGSIAARRLAAAGHDVVVLEEHETIGIPVHCTGLLGDEAFAEFAVPRHLILARAESASFWGAAGQPVRIESGAVRAAVIDRAGLDQWLAAEAAAAGAEIRSKARAVAVVTHQSGVRVFLDGSAQPIEARACVLACGANYRFHRALGLGLPAAFLQSAQAEVPFIEKPEIEVRFGRSVAPGGFAWMVPFRGNDGPMARVGIMSETSARTRFASLLQSLGGSRNPETVVVPRLKMLPLAPVARTFGDRVVAVGDAAGLVKPTTGGGIYYGMLSGVMAAGVLDQALRKDRLDGSYLAKYEHAWRRRLGAEIRTGLRFRKIMSRLSDDSINALINLARVDGVVPLLKETASFNWHRRAAMALLGHPAFRHIALKSWTRGAGPI